MGDNYLFAQFKEKQYLCLQMEPITTELIQRLNKGDVSAFDTIYHTYYLYLCSIAVYYVHDRDVAAQIVNDVFLSFWQHREAIVLPVLGYLRRSVRNAVLNYLQSHLYNTGTLLLTDGKLWDYVQENVLSKDDPLETLNNKELHDLVAKQVETLPPRCRAIFKAYMFDNLDYEEIAQKEQISISTVRVQMKIALDRLRKELHLPVWIIVLLIS